MEKKHPVEEVLGLTMDKLREMVDANTVIGDPIHTPEGVTVIPVSKISMGLISGGSDLFHKNQTADRANAYGGASSAGVNIMPLGFLIINGDSARMLPVDQSASSPLGKIMDLAPEVMGKVSNILDQRKVAKSEAKEARKKTASQDEAKAEEN
jgi:sporulation protein YtfJ